jgi:hypothetical protein
MTGLNIDDARCRALFASRLQPSDAPAADSVATAIRATVRQFGIRGCAGLMAQEFGDHPEAAAERMRWARRLLTGAPAPAHTGYHGPGAPSPGIRLTPRAAPCLLGREAAAGRRR